MTPVNTILTIMIFSMLAGGGIFIFLTLRKKKELPVPKQHLINHLARFNGNRPIGREILTKPVGSNKQLRKVVYAVAYKDEYDHQKVDYETVIVHQDFIVKTENYKQLIPKHSTELEQHLVDNPQLREVIHEAKNFNTIAKATQASMDLHEIAFTEHYGGQMYAKLMTLKDEQIKEALKLQQNKEPEKVKKEEP